VPLVFGLGGPLVAMAGTCIGAGQRERAIDAAWIGAVGWLRRRASLLRRHDARSA
jgi:hypothetical protein